MLKDTRPAQVHNRGGGRGGHHHRLSPTGQQRLHLRGRFLLEPRNYVAVGVEGEADGAVAQYLLDDLRMDALREQQRRGGVPQVVEAHPWQPGPPRQGPFSDIIWGGAPVAQWIEQRFPKP